MKDELQKINRQLKVDLNESGFISMNCRNKVLRIFADEFQVDLDIGNYQNVDLSIDENYKVHYRDDLYTSRDSLSDIEDVEERFSRFQGRVDQILSKKELSFEKKGLASNVFNLILLFLMFLVAIVVVLYCIWSFLIGNIFHSIWFVVVILPLIVPKFKDHLSSRIIQAKRFFKSLFKKKN